MITHIYVAKLKPGTPADKVRAWLAEIDALQITGMRSLVGGTDLGLREGNQDVAIVGEFEDAQAWRRYDEDELHNRIRAEHARPLVESQQRVQFEAPGDRPPGRIRNVTLIDFKPDTDPDLVATASQRLAGLKVPGMHWIDAGPDLGLQTANASAGVICDFTDAAAYRAYDADGPHNEIRRDIAHAMAGARRVQFQVGG